MDNVLSFGDGARALVVIPGLSATKVTAASTLLKGVFKQFTSEWTVYVIDRPEIIPEGTTNESLAETYAAIMEEIGINDADIIGVSQGGMIAQYIAIRHPEMVHQLVLGASLSRMNNSAEAVFDGWLRLVKEENWYEYNMDTFNRLYSDSFLERRGPALKTAARLMKADDKERFIRLVKACRTGGPYDELRKIKCPVLVMGSEDDAVLTGEASREMAEALGCELYMFKGYRHAIYDEAEDFYPRAYNFLHAAK